MCQDKKTKPTSNIQTLSSGYQSNKQIIHTKFTKTTKNKKYITSWKPQETDHFSWWTNQQNQRILKGNYKLFLHESINHWKPEKPTEDFANWICFKNWIKRLREENSCFFLCCRICVSLWSFLYIFSKKFVYWF